MKRTVHHSDGRSDGPKPFSPRRIEVYTGSQERRRWPDEEKARIVIESFAPDTVVTQLAQRHGCRAQQIHNWRRLARTGKLTLPAATSEALPAFVPLLPDNSTPAPAPASPAAVAAEACIAVEIADATVRVSGRPGAEALLDVFSALRRSRRC
jgi:transposase